jgi:8-oxo-dGTP pyrophosphatase MutT (NUDIX family)
MTWIDDTWYERPEGMTRERHAAGGVVVRLEKGNLFVALIREIDTDGTILEGYVLPKGGMEPGEDFDAASRREIHEEAGLTELTALGHLADLERQDSKQVYWAFNHYGLYLTAQMSGEILDAAHHFDFGWFPLEDLPPMFWPDEQAMIRKNRHTIYDRVIAHQNPKPRKQGFL